MKLKVITLLGAGLLALTACGAKAVDYNTFHLKANEAYEKAKTVTFETVTYKQTEGTDVNTEIVVRFEKGAYGLRSDTPLDKTATAMILVALLDASMAVVVNESEGMKYYINGFKVVDGDTTATFNEYGLITSSKTKDAKFTVTYKK